MGLKEYEEKRNFEKTKEPQHSLKPTKKNPIYVIQQHKSRHLHYDLRLEQGGVLKSWAIPKEPPQTVGLKRLAIKVEDHPLGYERFEGNIPKGEYGTGIVAIWDSGTYAPIKQDSFRWEINIYGKKLNGSYCLMKLKRNTPEDKNWLFFKMKKIVK